MSDNYTVDDLSPIVQNEIPVLGNSRRIMNLSDPKFTEMLSIHEASHFVFTCFLLKYFNDFTQFESASVCVEKLGETGWNQISGVAPKGYTEEELNERKVKQDFYSKNKPQTIGRIFSSLAGYYSYKIYIEDTDFFVAIKNEENVYFENFNVGYNYRWVGDFLRVKEYLEYLNKYNRVGFEKAVILLDGVKEILEIQAIRDSIIFTSRFLKKIECKKLEGAGLIKIQNTVNRLTNKVPYMGIINKYAVKI